eukprot:2896703-Alexandrium_andersonii.AAC.1
MTGGCEATGQLGPRLLSRTMAASRSARKVRTSSRISSRHWPAARTMRLPRFQDAAIALLPGC